MVLTNLYGLKVFELDDTGAGFRCVHEVDLRVLATVPFKHAVEHSHAGVLATVLNDFRFQRLSRDQKIDRVRTSPPWNPGLEITASDWVLRRLDAVVELIRSDVAARASAGDLLDPTVLPVDDQALVERELREMDKRVGSSDRDADGRSLRDYANASGSSKPALAMRQFISHTAFYVATRLLLVRAWEDSGLLAPAALYDGGFDKLMIALENVSDVVATAFTRAGRRYPDLFNRHNAFSWYQPTDDVYTDAVYELANTYFGNLSDDILGEVYQRELARVDRKQLGQYYTPRDIIKLIWDLVDLDRVQAVADREDRPVRILDIATGSGGFLVEGVARRRARFIADRNSGAQVTASEFLADVTSGAVGCEVQQFSAYLAEVNLVLQLSPLLQGDARLRLPALRLHCVDTLTLHNPDEATIVDVRAESGVVDDSGLRNKAEAETRQDSLERIKDPKTSGEWLDVAIGNPPYVGEKLIADTLRDLYARYPYWRQFSASHIDYLYNFLILGISKLRQGGRFGFITTEYWLKATGAAPLRKYLAEHTRIERLVLFRSMTLFPDAPGQHNLIVIGERITDTTEQTPPLQNKTKPKVSVYTGPARPETREHTLKAVREGTSRTPAAANIKNFESLRSPAKLGGDSWAEAVMTREQLARRTAVARTPRKANIVMSEGVLAPPQALRGESWKHLSTQTVADLGGRDSHAGVFVLSADECDDLSHMAGSLSNEERIHLRPVINTADVFPYGVVLPARPRKLIWLPTSHGGDEGQFPANMPAFEGHLKRFRPLLEATVEKYGQGQMIRPWWSSHRPRTELVEGHAATGQWSDLAVTTRWGDRKLLTGLAPKLSLPLSGLHAVTGGPGTSAAYLVGLFNSTPVQELAEALAPGSVSQEDIAQLGLPQFDSAITKKIEKATLSLANTVRDIVLTHGDVWPGLPDALRFDITLGGNGQAAWTPSVIRRGWGTFDSVPWIRVTVEAARGQVQRTELVDDLFGRHLVVHFARGRVTIDVDEHGDADLRALLELLVHGAGTSGALSPGAIKTLPVPLTADALVTRHVSDVATADQVINKYRELRTSIDQTVVAALEATSP